jgi:predicted nucleic acid-binding protein
MRGLERSLERVALDSSVLIEIVAGSQSVKRLVEDIARGLIEAYTSSLNMVEVLYITCRM